MTVLLLPISYLILVICFLGSCGSLRKAVLLAAIGMGLLLTAQTELLSMFGQISQLSIAVFWVVTAVSGSILLYRRTIRPQLTPVARTDEPISIGLAVIVAIPSFITLLIAVISPPNNWDTMTYHLARVMHWMQNGSLAHYPTHIPRQLYLSPLAEYALMHLQLLSGGDRLANLVQWCSMLGCVAGVTLLAQEMGGNRQLQLLSAAVAATIPMGILQASSTQNDLVVSFWLICFVYFGMLTVKDPRSLHIFGVGGSLGLAVLTKGTAYFLATPFIFWLTFVGLKRYRRSFLKQLFVIACVPFVLNAGHYWRNYALWGNPLSTNSDKVTNDHITPAVALSNISRNLVSNTWTRSETANILQYRGILAFHDIIGMDVSDPGTSLNGTEFVPAFVSYHEDHAGNGLHLLLLIAAFAGLLRRTAKPASTIVPYAVCLATGFILFSLLLKWQPWITRLQLPFFVLGAPITALALPFGGKKPTAIILSALLLLCSGPWLLKNQSRPLMGDWSIISESRESLYFVNNPTLYPYYRIAAERAAQFTERTTIGLVSESVDAYEYPLWVLLQNRMDNMPRIEHINVDNISGTITLHYFQPDLFFKIK